MAKNKKKKEAEPQYYMSQTNIPTYNYKVYYMSKIEKVLYFLLAFAAGAAVGYLFYGGIGKDQYGDPTKTTYTLNILIPSIVGLIAAKLFLPIRTEQIVNSRKQKINRQFRDLLEALSTSLGAGKNVQDSFKSVYEDLKVQYDEDAFILKELEVILSGIENNIDIEELLLDFGWRTDNEDIYGFANVFKVCYRKGGNIKETMKNTHQILSEKMEISEEIQTIITGNKTEQNLMIVMPIALIGVIKMISPDFAANFVTPTGIIATTLGVIIFVVAYFVGKKVLDIKV